MIYFGRNKFLRLYGAQDAFWDQTFKLPDVEVVP
jgi:hypothetical protein